MANNLMAKIGQAVEMIQTMGAAGTPEEIQQLLSEKGVSLAEFQKQANQIMNNPLYMGMLKKAGAPIDDIKRALKSLGGGVQQTSTPAIGNREQRRASGKLRRL